MPRSLSSLRLLVVVAAILASSACTGNPFAPGEVISSGPKPPLDLCADPANVGSPRADFATDRRVPIASSSSRCSRRVRSSG